MIDDNTTREAALLKRATEHNITPMAAAMAAAQAKLAKVNPDLVPPKRKDPPFDPLHYYTEVLQEPELQCRLLTNAVWALDTAIVGACKSMYFEIRKENPQCNGNLGALIDAYHGTYSSEGYWGEGSAHELVKLLAMQPAWHDAAFRYAHMTGWLTFKPKSIDELVLAIKPMTIKGNEETNMRAMAKMTAARTMHLEERYRLTEEQVFKASKDAVIAANKEDAEFQRGLAPAIQVFMDEARTHLYRQQLVDNTTIDFTDLPLRTRMSIANKLAKGIPRALNDVRRIESVTFNMCMAESMAAQQTVDQALAAMVDEMEAGRT